MESVNTALLLEDQSVMGKYASVRVSDGQVGLSSCLGWAGRPQFVSLMLHQARHIRLEPFKVRSKV
jgi:hypothetical protein